MKCIIEKRSAEFKSKVQIKSSIQEFNSIEYPKNAEAIPPVLEPNALSALSLCQPGINRRDFNFLRLGGLADDS